MPDAAVPSRPRPAPPSFASQALRVAAKDLRIEWSSGEILTTMTFLALVVVLCFAVAFVAGDERPGPAVTAGVLWIALAFSGTVALARTFDRERDGAAFRGLLLSPAPRAAIYLGKVAASAAFMLAVQVVVVPLCAIFFSAAIGEHAGRVAIMLALGIVGFAAAGSIFSAALMRSRSRDVLLSTLLYPIVTPVLIAGARGTSQLLDPMTPGMGGPDLWTQFLGAVDVLFVVAGLWAFEPVVSGD